MKIVHPGDPGFAEMMQRGEITSGADVQFAMVDAVQQMETRDGDGTRNRNVQRGDRKGYTKA